MGGEQQACVEGHPRERPDGRRLDRVQPGRSSFDVRRVVVPDRRQDESVRHRSVAGGLVADDGDEQDAGGRVWIAPTRKRVLVFEADELAEPLTRFCDLMSLRLASTLGELLEKHELARRDLVILTLEGKDVLAHGLL